jgi:ribonuclease P/MRP protein subunit POP1
MRSPASLPSACILALTVNNPKITNFKKKHSENNIKEEILAWPSDVSESNLWDENQRKLLQSKPVGEYSTVPIILVQQSGGLSRGFGSGWDLILPAHFGMAFWVPCIYAGARAIGTFF